MLLGQPQFRRLLSSPNLDQLRQRVLTSYHLGPLSRAETRAYVEHRLGAVGWTGDPHWDEASFEAVFTHTGGVPRRINRLCSRVLLYGVLEEAHDITGDVVDATAAELAHDLDGVEAGGLAMPPAAPSHADLLARVEALEQRMAAREQVFRRLGRMLGAEDA